VELLNWGTAHTRGDQVIHLPAEKIIFAGDLIEERMFPIFPWFPPNDADVNAVRWVSILKGFHKFSPQFIVPGHGDIGSIAIADDLAEQIVVTSRETDALLAAKASPDDIKTKLKEKIAAAYPNWEHAELLDWEIRYFVDNPKLSFEL
jgi:glyoxylase-like metal-dependent hydrolase (beta-lactamase superfamily II)